MAGPGPLVFFVRHAEKTVDRSGRNDPDLSGAGQERAEALAHLLQDAQIKTIFVTEFKRTQETAAPLAKILGITPVVVPANDINGLVARLRDLPENALVVGHGDTIPRLVGGFGIRDPVNIPEQDYDELFLLSREPIPQLLRLHQSE